MAVCHIVSKLCYWHWLYLYSLAVHKCCFFLFLSHCQPHFPFCTATAVIGQQLVHSTVFQFSGGDGETAILCQLQGVVRYDLSVLMIPGEGGLWIPPHHHFEEHTFSLNSSRVSWELLNLRLCIRNKWLYYVKKLCIYIPRKYSSSFTVATFPERATLYFACLFLRQKMRTTFFEWTKLHLLPQVEKYQRYDDNNNDRNEQSHNTSNGWSNILWFYNACIKSTELEIDFTNVQ